MKQYPDIIRALIDKLSIFPGVGYRTAERYVYFLLRQNPAVVKELGQTIMQLPDKLKYCQRCFDYSDTELCRLCLNPSRKHEIICVVSQPYDIPAIEQTGYDGTYFILGGELQPLAGIGPEQLRLRELMALAEKQNPAELILAFNPDKEGEATAIFVSGRLKSFNPKYKITRIAKGLTLGSAIEYADEVSLTAAMDNRREI